MRSIECVHRVRPLGASIGRVHGVRPRGASIRPVHRACPSGDKCILNMSTIMDFVLESGQLSTYVKGVQGMQQHPYDSHGLELTPNFTTATSLLDVRILQPLMYVSW